MNIKLALIACSAATLLLCGCATPKSKSHEPVFEVTFYSEAEKSAPFVSLRKDRKLFVIRVQENRGVVGYDGKLFDVVRADAAELKKQATAVFKLGQAKAVNCTNGVRLSISMGGEQRELCVTPGKNTVVDELFEDFNLLLPDADRIRWK